MFAGPVARIRPSPGRSPLVLEFPASSEISRDHARPPSLQVPNKISAGRRTIETRVLSPRARCETLVGSPGGSPLSPFSQGIDDPLADRLTPLTDSVESLAQPRPGRTPLGWPAWVL